MVSAERTGRGPEVTELSPVAGWRLPAAGERRRGDDIDPRRADLLASLLLWKGAWLAAVIGAGRGSPLVGSIIAAGLVAISLGRRRAPPREIAFILAAAAAGFAIDSALVLADRLSIPESARLGAPSTVWMALLWSNLAAHLAPGSLFGWLASRPALSAALGAASGPLAYLGGAALGAVTFPEDRLVSIAALAAVWGLAFPALFRLRRALLAPSARAAGALAP